MLWIPFFFPVNNRPPSRRLGHPTIRSTICSKNSTQHLIVLKHRNQRRLGMELRLRKQDEQSVTTDVTLTHIGSREGWLGATSTTGEQRAAVGFRLYKRKAPLSLSRGRCEQCEMDAGCDAECHEASKFRWQGVSLAVGWQRGSAGHACSSACQPNAMAAATPARATGKELRSTSHC